jgi:hypothetical protein
VEENEWRSSIGFADVFDRDACEAPHFANRAVSFD